MSFLRFFLLPFLASAALAMTPVDFNVRDFGAKGDGVALDSPAINAAIEAAAAAGGGVVRLPAGRYLSFSLRLRSHLQLRFDPGAVLVAVDPASGLGRYDDPEPNPSNLYQDFGHSHWRNSLIWGEGLENVSIVGPGFIDGTAGLVRHGPPPKRPVGEPGSGQARGPERDMSGIGNKAIALKNCRNVTLRDFSVLNAGHFALLATGVDHLTIDNVKVDSNRDGFDIDACRHVRISNCSVNTPNDDAIVLKASYALGERRSTENVIITNCTVSGFDVGSMLDGTFRRTQERAPDRDGPTGRIKFGTESNGDFRNITIANCIFVRSRGLALESVDGGVIEDVTVTNLAMSEIVNAPIFLRLGNRARGPAGTPIGAIRRVQISHVTVNDCDARYPILIAGLENYPIEDLTLSDLHLVSRGGLSPEIVARQPAELVNPFFLRGDEAGITGPRDPFAVPQRAAAYPEPSMFGLLPASFVYARHVRALTVSAVTLRFQAADTRPLVVLEQAEGVTFENVRLPADPASPRFVLRQVADFEAHRCTGVDDVRFDAVSDHSF
ncbi:MAG TPA: glycosyl hydrolase family 28-related protein [Opitutus sp.]|nr:glycosyl hydrolase family 28-related protein [Opitutus sp.]